MAAAGQRPARISEYNTDASEHLTLLNSGTSAHWVLKPMRHLQRTQVLHTDRLMLELCSIPKRLTSSKKRIPHSCDLQIYVYAVTQQLALIWLDPNLWLRLEA